MVPLLTGAIALVNSRIHPDKKRSLYKYLFKLAVPYKETQCAGDAVTMAKTSNAPVIIAAGGDGTINEVLNGMDVDKQKLLIVPAGTLNVISHAIGNTSIDSIFTQTDHLKEVDADFLDCVFCQSNGTMISRRVLGFVACGYGGSIIKYASRLNILFPALRYILASWIAVLVNRPFKTEYVVNEKRSTRSVTGVIINNCGADRFSTIKKYSIQDRVFEVQHINLPFILQLFHIFLCKVKYNGGHQKVSSIKLDWKRPVPVMMDGELFENITSISVTVKSGLKLICSSQRGL